MGKKHLLEREGRRRKKKKFNLERWARKMHLRKRVGKEGRKEDVCGERIERERLDGEEEKHYMEKGEKHLLGEKAG